MAHVWHTGFELGTGKCKVANGQALDATTRFSYGRSYRLNANEYVQVGAAQGVNHATIITGFAAYESGYAQDIVRFYGDNSGTLHGSVRHASDGTVQAIARGTVLATSAGTVSFNAWHYWEVKYVLHDSTGSITVKCDGATVVTITGADTKNGGTLAVINDVYFGSTANHGFYLDDMYINDGSGSSDNDFWGDIAIKTCVPTGAGNSTGLTPSTGSNWSCVDEALNAAPNTSDYCGSPTPGTKDTYAMTDLSGTVPSIKGISANVYAAKSDAGAISGRRLLRAGGTDYAGPDLTLSASYQWFPENVILNPATGVAWTKADIDALEPGYEVRA
jgi:hypothetical protein